MPRGSPAGRGEAELAYTPASSAAVGSAPSAATCAAGPVASTSAVPSALGRCDQERDRHAVRRDARVGVEQRDDLRQGGESLAQRHRRCRDDHGQMRRSSTQRRASPATWPPSAVAIVCVTSRARGSSAAGAPALARERARRPLLPLRTDAGHSSRRPARRRRSSAACACRAPRAMPVIRSALSPSMRPRATSPSASRRSSVSSAISPVSTSSRSFASMPRPMPRSSRARPCRTSGSTGTGAARISCAARRCILPAGRHVDAAGVECCALAIPDGVEGGDDFAREAAGLLQHGLDHVVREVAIEALAPRRRKAGRMVERRLDVGNRGPIGHDALSGRWCLHWWERSRWLRVRRSAPTTRRADRG